MTPQRPDNLKTPKSCSVPPHPVVSIYALWGARCIQKDVEKFHTKNVIKGGTSSLHYTSSTEHFWPLLTTRPFYSLSDGAINGRSLIHTQLECIWRWIAVIAITLLSDVHKVDKIQVFLINLGSPNENNKGKIQKQRNLEINRHRTGHRLKLIVK